MQHVLFKGRRACESKHGFKNEIWTKRRHADTFGHVLFYLDMQHMNWYWIGHAWIDIEFVRNVEKDGRSTKIALIAKIVIVQ